MNETKPGILTFIKRAVVVTIFIVFIVLTVYACNCVNTVSDYYIKLNNCIGWVYQTEDQKMMLVINSETEAYLNAADDSGVYAITMKDNVLFLEKGEEDHKTTTIFIPLKKDEIFWQSKNILFYHYAEDAE